jgi:hypothetical protein
MSDRPISAADLAALKGATRDLVTGVGGVERAAATAGMSRATVARWYAMRDERDPEAASTVTIDPISIAALESEMAAMGDPRRPVTACLARLGGRRLADEAVASIGRPIGEAVTALMGALGPLIETLVAGLADGTVTASEAALGDRAAVAAEEALVKVRSALAAIRAGAIR